MALWLRRQEYYEFMRLYGMRSYLPSIAEALVFYVFTLYTMADTCDAQKLTSVHRTHVDTQVRPGI